MNLTPKEWRYLLQDSENSATLIRRFSHYLGVNIHSSEVKLTPRNLGGTLKEISISILSCYIVLYVATDNALLFALSSHVWLLCRPSVVFPRLKKEVKLGDATARARRAIPRSRTIVFHQVSSVVVARDSLGHRAAKASHRIDWRSMPRTLAVSQSPTKTRREAPRVGN